MVFHVFLGGAGFRPSTVWLEQLAARRSSRRASGCHGPRGAAFDAGGPAGEGGADVLAAGTRRGPKISTAPGCSPRVGNPNPGWMYQILPSPPVVPFDQLFRGRVPLLVRDAGEAGMWAYVSGWFPLQRVLAQPHYPVSPLICFPHALETPTRWKPQPCRMDASVDGHNPFAPPKKP